MAQGTSGGFNVTIRALDEVTSVADRIKRELRSLGEAPQLQVKATNSLFDKLGLGIRETGRGLAEIGHKARETGERLHKAFEPIAEITGLGGVAAIGSIGGIALALDKYASSGANLLRTSQAMGINVETLQRFQHGAKLAGSDAGALTEGLDVLNQKLRGAAWGSDAGAVAVFKQLNIALRDSNGQIRKAQDVLPEIADAVKRNIVDPYIAGEIAQKTLGESARVLFPYLRDGAEGLERFNREAAKYGAGISDLAAHNSHEFETSLKAVDIAIIEVGNSIAEKVLPVLTPMVQGIADWTANNREWIATGIGDQITEFGKTLHDVDWKSVGADLKFVGEGFVVIGKSLDGLRSGVDILRQFYELQAHEGATVIDRGNPKLGFGAFFDNLVNKPDPLGQIGDRLFNNGVPRGARMPQIFGVPGAGQAGAMPGNDFFKSIATAEGTLKNGLINYDATYGGAKPPPKPLSQMTIAEVRAYAHSTGGDTAPVGAFQIQGRTTMGDAQRGLNLRDDALFDATTQRNMAVWIARKQGLGAWAGFNANPAARASADAALQAGPTVQPGGGGGGGFWHGLGKAFGISGANAAPMPGFSVPSPAGTRGAVVDDMIGMLNLSGANPKVRQFIKENGGRIDPLTTAWCAAFIDAAYQHENLPGQHSDWAMSWRNFGKPVKPGDVQKGDIAVFPQGHVGAFTGETDPKTGLPQVISGNQGGNHEGGNPGMVGLRGVDPSSVWIRRSPAGDAPPVNLATPDQNAGAGDSSHNVQVTFANAPQGMRTGVQASGSANFTLRTQHALETW